MEKVIRFDNGLRLVMCKIDGLHSITCGVWVAAGATCENEESNGISHFIEHMLFKGTDKRSSFQISEEIDRIGGQINAFTTKESTCYYTRTTKDHIGVSVELLSDMFFNSKFDSAEMEKEKNVILEEISMVEDTPEDLCMDLLSLAYFKKNPLGQPILGTPENVKGFNKKNIESYMAQRYVPCNVVISIAGNMDFDACEKLVGKHFANNFPKTKTAIASDFGAKAIVPKREFLTKKKEIEQCHVALCFPSIEYNNADNDKYNIVNTVFGGGMSSRLFQKIREEQGFAYTIYSYISAYKNNGALAIYAGVNAKNVDELIDSIYKEIDILKAKKISKDEFLRGKEQLKGAFVFGQESTPSLMNLYGKFMLMTDKVFDFDKKLESLNTLKYQDVNDVIEKMFNVKDICGVVVGNYSNDFKGLFKSRN